MIEWGHRYTVDGVEVDTLTQVIERQSEVYGFTASVGSLPPGAMRIRSVQRARWYRVIVSGLAQRVFWELSPEREHGGRIDVRLDHRWFWWYRVFVIALAVPAGWFGYLGVRDIVHFLDVPGSLSVWPLIRPWIGAALVFMLAHAVLADGRLIQLLDSVRADLRGRGALLDRSPVRTRDRKLPVAGLMVAYVAAACLFGLAGLEFPGSWSAEQSVLLASACVALLMVAGVLKGLRVSTGKFGADDRFAALAPTLFMMLAILFLLTSQMSFILLGKIDGGLWDEVFLGQRLMGSTNDPTLVAPTGNTASPSRIEFGLSQFRLTVGLLLSMAAGMWAMGFMFLVKSVSCVDLVINACQRIRRDIQTSSARASASGGSFLRGFRTAFAATWVLFAVLAGTGVISLICVSLGALRVPAVSDDPNQPTGVIVSSAHVVSFFMGLGGPSPVTITLSRLFWVGCPMAMLALIVLSVGSLARRRHRTQHCLITERVTGTVACDGTPVSTIAARLAARAQSRVPDVVVMQHAEPYAAAHVFGLRGRRCFLEVSTAALDLLDASEVEALLAHEWAHHLGGHCRLHLVLQCLGRITLVGGAYVGALEDSFGYELAADRAAVFQLRVDPQALRRCLIKMQVATLVGGRVRWPVRFSDPVSATPASPDNHTPFRLRIATRWTRRLRLWRTMYTFDSAVSYWYPSVRERIDALERLIPECGPSAPASDSRGHVHSD